LLLAPPARAQRPSAEALYEAGALRAAADSFAARAAAEPQVAAHWYDLGATLYRAGADGKATAAWTLAARLAPRNAVVRRARRLLPPPDAASESLLAVGPATPAEWWFAATLAWWLACGLVIARRRARWPASVVKELVENALDAGARAIRVELEDGGKTLIRVSDDGEGMSADDARLALQRHATSKIRSAGDLIGVGTFGFRGEALPAIASVSRLELETSMDGRAATRLRVVGGRIEAGEETARQRGTTIAVRGLFFNTPARRKFLRAPATETRAASEALSLLALARPDVAIALTSDGRVVIDAPSVERLIDRVHALWGRELADTLLPIAYREGPVEVTGFCQRPSQAKPAGRKAHVFVRGRPIRDPFLVRAAEAGYRSTIHPGDRPSLLLFLDVAGDAVDVNVHPAKLEVRFRDKFLVEKVCEEAVRAALVPLAAAAPLGQVSGGGYQVSGEAWEAAGGSDIAVPLELFAQGPPAPDTWHLAPPLLQVFDSYILFQT